MEILMSSAGRPPDARPLFRKLALAIALVCFILAGVFGWAGSGELAVPITCLIVGAMMGAIGLTGYWPPRGRK